MRIAAAGQATFALSARVQILLNSCFKTVIGTRAHQMSKV